MFLTVFSMVCERLLYFALHVFNNNSFKKPLSKEEELICFKRLKEGDESSRDILIEHNLRLVAHVIKKYYTRTNDQDDLISIGTIGLIKAVSNFDYEKGVKFATYGAD